MQEEKERLLFEQAQKGEKEARETLIIKHIGLVRHVIKRYAGRGYDADDLFQLGAIGLIKAIEKFDVDYGVCFSSYAVPMIAGEIRRFLRDDGMVKVSRGIKEHIWKINQAREQLFHELGRDATLQELAAVSGLSIEDIVVAFDAGREVESIYKTVYQSDGNEIYLMDQLEDSQSGNDRLLDRLLVDELMEQLDEKERLLIKLRFYENQTQVQVAEKLGMSQVQVSRLEKRILLRMRQQVTGSYA